jgi:hypothetical protein
MSNKVYGSTSTTIFYVREDDAATIETARVAAETARIDGLVASKVAEAIAFETKGLKAKNEELLGKLATQKTLYNGIDPTKVKEMLERLDQDEDTKLLAEGKKHLVIEKYTERMRAEQKSQLEVKDLAIKAQFDRADSFKDRVLDNQIRSVASGLHKGAVEDALLQARQIFSLDAKGNAVKLDAQGVPELGKDGTTPFSPAEWIELQKESKPHWFPSGTSGSGAGDARSGDAGTGKTMKRVDFDKLTGHAQMTAISAKTKIVD